jgi:16S rRNA (guanine1516-N2)-methyltransferase
MSQASSTILETHRVTAVGALPADHPDLAEIAANLARELDLPLVNTPSQSQWPLFLAVTPNRLELHVLTGDPQLKGGKPVASELARIDIASPPGGRLNQPLFKAVGLKKGQPYRPRVLDVTAGFGEDTWLLASKGCPVLALERNAVVATLLRDALRRAAEMQPALAERISVLQEDSREVLRALYNDHQISLPAEQPWHHASAPDPEAEHDRETGEPDELTPTIHWPRPEVVYIDPMFPTGRKAMERKPMRVLRQLIGGDLDSGELLALALKVATRRVVAKRPRKAPPLGGRAPTTYHRGRSLRYDVYATREGE